jgi:hypothetical protein
MEFQLTNVRLARHGETATTSKNSRKSLRGPIMRLHSPWIVIVEPDADAKLLVIVTLYGVSE